MVHRAVTARSAVAFSLVLSVGLLACCGPASDTARLDLGRLRVGCVPADAMLYVDGRFLGTVASLKGRAVALPEGLRRVEVRRQGYFSHLAEVQVAKGARRRLDVRLRKQPF